MRILGLDLSLTSTGYVLLEDDVVVWHGSVAPRSRDVERLAEFDKWFRNEAYFKFGGLDKDLQFVSATARPSSWLHHSGFAEAQDWHVAIEGYSFGSISHHHAIGELGGVMKLAVRQAGLPITLIPPAVWKKQVLGKGGLAKDQVRLEVFKRYGVEFASQDVVDAWCVAMCLRRQLLGLDKPAPKGRKRNPSPNPPLISAMEAAAHGDQTAARLR